ncbi:MAG: sel1 repeat family protein [Synergistaceae bacterium]|nr:sel1 repeat family protein [Synergistaceae bacterium]
MYASGRGVRRDYQQAVYWYRKAAEQGHAWAQNNLGAMYANGNGIKRDFNQAIYWWQKSAAQGNTSARANLATLGIYDY